MLAGLIKNVESGLGKPLTMFLILGGSSIGPDSEPGLEIAGSRLLCHG